MQLTECPMGKEFIIVACQADLALRRRLDTMGMLPGARITPIRNIHGNVVIKVCEGRVAIDKSLASRIFVA